MAAGDDNQALADAAVTAASKPKRVRTGCLTCRERHLKCDEALPNCMNCRKSARLCKRGVRLNFIDTQCKQPPVITSADGWSVEFLDESLEIASEYVGGEQQYSRSATNPEPPLDNNLAFEYNNTIHSAPVMTNQSLPAIQGLRPGSQELQSQNVNLFDQRNVQQGGQPMQGVDSGSFSNASLPSHHSPYNQIHQTASNPIVEGEAKEILNTQEETLYMQVFVEEVGLWMDSMDSMKHFSRILPFHALSQPMLLNAFLACGVRHLTLVNPAVYQEEKALQHYDAASRFLLRALENPERDSVICATTAVILNVYEIMTEKALMRMNHIAGARALIKECGWNARSEGIGAACFWVNVGMELLSNLHFNWQSSWNPDAWGLDLDLSMETRAGREEIWTHRILYITAKVGDFRATVPKTHEASPHNETMRRQKRFDEWTYLKSLADTWNSNVPRTMHPAAFLYPYQTTSKSTFPELWLIKRSTIIARLLYHTAMCLLAQVNPIMSKEVPEMQSLESHHAHQICGIVAHVKDRGVASVALRSLAIAAECLTIRREQEEALSIFIRIHKETGWRIGFIPKDLMEKWGWESTDASPHLPTQTDPHSYMNAQFVNGGMTGKSQYAAFQFDQYGEMQRLQQQYKQAQAQSSSQNSSPHAMGNGSQPQQPPQQPPPSSQQPAARKMPPQGIVNPMFASADFAMAKHPYQEYYVAPSHQHSSQQPGQPGGLGLGLGVATGGFGLAPGGGYQ